jgi:hypothetical protein
VAVGPALSEAELALMAQHHRTHLVVSDGQAASEQAPPAGSCKEVCSPFRNARTTIVIL